MLPTETQLSMLRRSLAFWHPVPDHQWPALATLFTSIDIGRSHALVSAGDREGHVYFVTEGLLRIYYLDRDGREKNKSFVSEGGFAGALSSFSVGKPSPFHIQALEPCQVLVAHWNDLETLYQNNPTLERLGRRIAEWLLVKKIDRERELLELDATERYQAFLEAHPTLVNRVPNYHIASYLGITDVSLSRIRQKRTT